MLTAELMISVRLYHQINKKLNIQEKCAWGSTQNLHTNPRTCRDSWRVCWDKSCGNSVRLTPLQSTAPSSLQLHFSGQDICSSTFFTVTGGSSASPSSSASFRSVVSAWPRTSRTKHSSSSRPRRWPIASGLQCFHELWEPSSDSECCLPIQLETVTCDSQELILSGFTKWLY